MIYSSCTYHHTSPHLIVFLQSVLSSIVSDRSILSKICFTSSKVLRKCCLSAEKTLSVYPLSANQLAASDSQSFIAAWQMSSPASTLLCHVVFWKCLKMYPPRPFVVGLSLSVSTSQFRRHGLFRTFQWPCLQCLATFHCFMCVQDRVTDFAWEWLQNSIILDFSTIVSDATPWVGL